MKKYELTENTKQIAHTTLYQIRALRDFGTVEEGELGGWIEKEENLSHGRNCWVFGNGAVFENGKVFGNGQVSENGQVFKDNKLTDHTINLINICEFGITASIAGNFINVGCKSHTFEFWEEYINSGSVEYLEECKSKESHESIKDVLRLLIKKRVGYV